MLYVFHVDAGLMTTYDMNLTLQSVSSLKQVIEKKTKIPFSSLVLLVSGGEVLQSDHMVSSYSAGTDTNPIYMFSKPSMKDGNFKQSHQYSVCDLSPIVELSTCSEWRSELRTGVEVKSVAEMKTAVELCCSMPPSVNTIVACAQLAQQFSECAREFSRCCDQLVHDQHLQHQGWSAVVANLEDIFNEFCERSKNFKESFKKHRQKKEQYHEQLNTLNEVLESLGKIPILAALQLNAEAHRFSAFDVFEEADFDGQYYQISAPLDNSSENKGYPDFGVEAFKLSEEDVFDEKQEWAESKPTTEDQPISEDTDHRHLHDSEEGGVSFKAHSFENKEELTLLHWMLAKGNKASLQDILDYCQKGLALIDADPLKEREAELCNILEYANSHGLKQIKGIEDRLYGLDQLLSDVKKLERDQHDQAASLIQNRERVGSACDPSVLPTLVQSHRCQLEKLLKNHEMLVDIRRRIAESKEELSHILKARLEAVLMIENSMSVQDAHQMLSFQCFNRLARYFDIVAQLHRAPAMFVRAVHEVARRRTFSDAFLQWASDLACNLLTIHSEEVFRRQEFNSIFHGHFLKSLFPGMEELPSVFGTQAPVMFDGRLPKLTEADVEFVSKAFPELAKDNPVYNMKPVVEFFKHRIAKYQNDGEKDNVDQQEDNNMDFECETVPNEFGQLAQSNTVEKVHIDMATSCTRDTNSVSTLTEDNMDSYKLHLEKLREFVIKFFQVCKVNILMIKDELVVLKNDIDLQKKFITTNYLDLLSAWEKSNEENAIRFREETQKMTVDHELELSDMKKIISNKDLTIYNQQVENDNLRLEHKKELDRKNSEHQSTKELLEEAHSAIKSFEQKLLETDVIKQREMKEMQDKMHMDYKAEIESLRSRFRLVALTNMDRSPSESSLEKIERTDVIEISSHNAILLQTKENAELEKEEALKEALEKCEQEWQQRLDNEITTYKSRCEIEKQATLNDAVRRIIEEKDRQLELLRERELNLVRECTKYKETIQQLTDPETNDYESLFKTQLATSETEKIQLNRQIEDLRKELEKKCEEYEKRKEDDSDGRSSPKGKEDRQSKSRGRCHTPWGLLAGTLSLSSCLPGHTVLVLWDPAHHNYTIMQEASIMYFVHSDCLPALELSINVKHENERRLYAIATVESKEYCYAKKSGNRYHMARGSRFYRVRVKPYRSHTTPPCCEQRHSKSHDIQKSVDISQSITSATDDGKNSEVATATLINLAESPAEKKRDEHFLPPSSEEQPDSIEANADWLAGRMQQSTSSNITDMECSVGRVLGPDPSEQPTESATAMPELAEEATP